MTTKPSSGCPLTNPMALALFAALALSPLSCGGGGPATGIPPQAAPKHSGPYVDTSALVPDEPEESASLHILHTNDLHGQVLPRKGVWIDKTNPPMVGGAHALAGYVTKVRDEVGQERVLLLDSGDIFAGTPEGNLTEGKMIVELMNALQYDAMALGNHEFDLGLDVLQRLGAQAEFPILAANLLPKPGTAGDKTYESLAPVTIVERNGWKIGVVGVIAKDTPLFTHKAAGESFEFGEPKVAVQDAIGTLKADGAEVIVVVSHVGQDGDKKMASELDGAVVAVLGGHSHTGIDPMWRADNGTAVTQTWGKGGGIYHLELARDGDGNFSIDGELVSLMAADYPEHPAVKGLFDKYSPDIEKVMGEQLGTCKDGLSRGRGDKSSPLGNFITDVMKGAYRADLAVHNKSGIRADIPPGDVTMRTLYNVAPFGNTLVTIVMTGKDLRDLFENSFTEGYRRLEVSGVKVRYDASKQEGTRVTLTRAGGKAIANGDKLVLVTNKFLAGGGDGHEALTRGKQKDTKKSLRNALADYFRKNKTCRVDDTARIDAVKK